MMRDLTMLPDDTSDDTLAIVRGPVQVSVGDGKGCRHVEFSHDKALAVLFAVGVVEANAMHWRDELPEADRKLAVLMVDCSGVFGWGFAEAEPLPFEEVERLYGCGAATGVGTLGLGGDVARSGAPGAGRGENGGGRLGRRGPRPGRGGRQGLRRRHPRLARLAQFRAEALRRAPGFGGGRIAVRIPRDSRGKPWLTGKAFWIARWTGCSRPARRSACWRWAG